MTVIAPKMLAPHPVDHFNKTSLQSENEYSGEKNKDKKNLLTLCQITVEDG